MKANNPFGVASTKQAVQLIFAAKDSGKEIAYVLKRWRVIGWLLYFLPTFVYKMIG